MNRAKTAGASASEEPAASNTAGGPREKRRMRFSPLAAARAAIAGLLMGIANLIPGVSGGTMILAMGLYEEFIDSVAEVSALRFSLRRVAFLAVLGAFAAGAIVGLAGAILYLLFHHTIAMFALFIGLTLGGAPMLFASLRPVRTDVVVAVLAGLALMVGVLLLKGGAGFPHNVGMDLVSGVVGSTTMVLPGVSGSYMLLVMDQYDRVVGAVDDLKRAVGERSAAGLLECLKIIVPVGIGVIVGIVALSNVLKVLLRRYHRATVGVLLGILLGSIIGLWPFAKAPGEKALERRSLEELQAFVAEWRIPETPGPAGADKEVLVHRIVRGWNDRQASPYSAGSVGIALALTIVGFAATFMLSRLGDKPGLGAGCADAHSRE